MVTQIAPGIRITVRSKDFLVTKVIENHNETKIIHSESISELIKGKRYIFDTKLEADPGVLEPVNT